MSIHLVHVKTTCTCQYIWHVDTSGTGRYNWYMSIHLIHFDTSGPAGIMENYNARACKIVPRSSASKMWSFINQGGRPIVMVLLSPRCEKRIVIYMPKTLAYNHDDTCHDVQCQCFVFVLHFFFVQWRLFIKISTDWQVSEVRDTRTPAAGPGRGQSVQIEWSSAGAAHLRFPVLLSVLRLLAREIMMNRRHSNV